MGSCKNHKKDGGAKKIVKVRYLCCFHLEKKATEVVRQTGYLQLDNAEWRFLFGSLTT